MTDTERPESSGVWIARTLGYVVVGAIVTVILTNAVQSYFLERIIPGVGPGVAGGVSAIIVGIRRKRRAPSPNAEKNT